MGNFPWTIKRDTQQEEITMSTTAPSPDHILQTGMAFFASKSLLSAVEMELFTELAKHPEDLETLTGRLGLHPRSSRDFLDALVALGFLERHDGIYSNTPSTESVSGQAQAVLRRRHTGDGEPAAVPALEQADERAENRPAAGRGGTDAMRRSPRCTPIRSG